mmetsp:Transcript_10217/g.15746  ORF Transcript_10217/g.15746 Transcript_10217/m.15746 type:complete len:94 (-) Transcript_10217:6-287(-)
MHLPPGEVVSAGKRVKIMSGSWTPSAIASIECITVARRSTLMPYVHFMITIRYDSRDFKFTVLRLDLRNAVRVSIDHRSKTQDGGDPARACGT